jgi:chromosome segregation ATPase
VFCLLFPLSALCDPVEYVITLEEVEELKSELTQLYQQRDIFLSCIEDLSISEISLQSIIQSYEQKILNLEERLKNYERLTSNYENTEQSLTILLDDLEMQVTALLKELETLKESFREYRKGEVSRIIKTSVIAGSIGIAIGVAIGFAIGGR